MQTIKTIDNLYYRELGKQIRKIRIHRNMTLKEVAQAMGTSRSLIDHWELGLNKITPKKFERLCEVLQVSNNVKIDVKIGFWE